MIINSQLTAPQLTHLLNEEGLSIATEVRNLLKLGATPLPLTLLIMMLLRRILSLKAEYSLAMGWRLIMKPVYFLSLFARLETYFFLVFRDKNFFSVVFI